MSKIMNQLDRAISSYNRLIRTDFECDPDGCYSCAYKSRSAGGCKWADTRAELLKVKKMMEGESL